MITRRWLSIAINDGHLAYLLNRACRASAHQRPGNCPDNIRQLLQRISSRLHRFRPRPLIEAMHDLSFAPAHLGASASLLRRMTKRFAQQQTTDHEMISPSSLVNAVDALTRLRSDGYRPPVLLAINRIVDALDTIAANDVVVAVRAISHAADDGITVNDDQWRRLVNRVVVDIDALRDRDVAAVTCSCLMSTSMDISPLIVKATEIAPRLDAARVTALLSATTRSSLPLTDLINALITRAITLSGDMSPPLITRCLNAIDGRDNPLAHELHQALTFRAVASLHHFNAVDLASIRLHPVHLHHYAQRALICLESDQYIPIGHIAAIVHNLGAALTARPAERVARRVHRLITACDLTPRSLALLSRAFAGVRFDQASWQRPLFQRISRCAMSLSSNCTAQDVAMLARSVVITLPREDSTRALVQAMMTRSLDIIDTLNEQHVSNLLWAMQMSGATGVPLSPFEERFMMIASTFTPEGLVNCARAFVTSPTTFATVLDEALSRLDQFPPAQLAMILATIAKHHADDRPAVAPVAFFDAAAALALQLLPTMTGDEMVSCMWSLVAVEHDAPDLFAAVLKLVPVFIPSLSAKSLANLLWSVAFAALPDLAAVSACADRAVTLLPLDAHTSGIVLWSLAALDATDVSEVQIDALWYSARATFAASFDAYPPATRPLWLTQMWLAMNWTALRYPTVVVDIDQEPMSHITRLAMLTSEQVPNAGSLFQQQVTASIMTMVGAANITTEVRCPKTLYPIDIVYTSATSGAKVAIEVDGPCHWFSRRRNGSTLLQDLLLRRVGKWDLKRISYNNWTDDDSHLRHIQQRLQQYDHHQQ